MLAAGVLLVLLGGFLVRRALGRRSPVELSLGAGTHAWVTPTAAGRVAALAASDVDGVVTVRARARRRAVVLQVTALDTVAGTVGDEVRDAVGHALAGLEPQPRVRVSVSSVGGSR